MSSFSIVRRVAAVALAFAAIGCANEQGGYHALQKGDYGLAVQEYSACVTSDCADSLSHIRYAFALYKAGHLPQALELFGKLKTDPDVATYAYYWSGLTNLAMGNRLQAITDWRHCKPHATEVRYAVYEALWQVENYKAADVQNLATVVDADIQAAYSRYLTRVEHDADFPAAASDSGLNMPFHVKPRPFIP